MGYKKATYLTLAVLTLLAGAYFWATIELRDPGTRGSIGPGYFPVILSVLLVILCAISFVQTLRSEEDRVIRIPNLGFVAAALVLVGLFLTAWHFLDAFYAVAFAFVAALMTLFSPRGGVRQHAFNLTLALVLIAGVYGLFGFIMQVRF